MWRGLNQGHKGIGFFLNLILFFLCVSPCLSAGPGTTGGLLFLYPTGARSAALAGAYSAGTDDITTLGFNPGSLATMKSGQMSVMYQKGFTDETVGQFLIGGPTKKGHVGFSAQALDGGTINVSENGESREARAQRDMTMGLTYGQSMGPLSMGFTAKILQSELIESESARAYAGDFGVILQHSSRFRFGAAVQNIGSTLKFHEVGDPLPRVVRAGFSMNLGPVSRGIALLADAPMFLNEQEWRPSLGLEWPVGPLVFRGGVRHLSGQNEITLGTGFLFGWSQLDYALGIFGVESSEHRLAWSMKFGVSSPPSNFVRSPTEKMIANVPQKDHKPSAKVHQVYKVKPGDSLSKIAMEFYGQSRLWSKIYMANRHLMADPSQMEVGQRIVIP